MRTVHCLNMYQKVAGLSGDVIELGVARGDTTFPLAGLMMCLSPEKKLYACDTFDGLPYDDAIISESMCHKGEINWGNSFHRILAVRGDQNIVSIKGLVEDTLPEHLSDKKFSFAWVDMDLYQPTSFAYKFLEGRMVIGGIIGFHDYGFIRCPGIGRVVDNEIDKQKYRVIFNQHTCIYVERIK